MRGWRVVVRASRSTDSTSVGLSYRLVIAQTRERNCWGIIDDMARVSLLRNSLAISKAFSYGRSGQWHLYAIQAAIGGIDGLVAEGAVASISLMV